MPSTNRLRRNALFALLMLALVRFCAARLQSNAPAQPPRRQPVQPSNPQLVDPAIERRVNDLLRKMTLDEKIGQLVQYNASQAQNTGPTTAALNVNPPGPNGIDSSSPVQVAGGMLFQSISSGYGHSCGVTTAGRYRPTTSPRNAAYRTNGSAADTPMRIRA